MSRPKEIPTWNKRLGKWTYSILGRAHCKGCSLAITKKPSLGCSSLRHSRYYESELRRNVEHLQAVRKKAIEIVSRGSMRCERCGCKELKVLEINHNKWVPKRLSENFVEGDEKLSKVCPKCGNKNVYWEAGHLHCPRCGWVG